MKKFAFIALIFALTLSLTACGGESEVEIDDVNSDYRWIETDLSSLLPKPDAEIVDSREYTDAFFADVYGVTEEDFDDYVVECKDSGFTNVIEDEDDKFKATNDDGVELVIDYIEDSKSFTIGLTLTEE